MAYIKSGYFEKNFIKSVAKMECLYYNRIVNENKFHNKNKKEKKVHFIFARILQFRWCEMDTYIMGIDVGTSGCKVAVYSADGEVMASSYHAYEMIYPCKGAMELDANEVFDAVLDCIGSCGKTCDLGKVIAFSVSTQGEAVILTGEDDEPLHHAIVTFDSRNEKEYQWFSGQFTKEEIMQLTGLPMHPMFSATKILYLRHNFREKFNQAKKIMCFGDYISYRLGAFPAIDYSMATRTMMFDIHEKAWSDKILKVCHIDKSLLSRPVKSGTVIGTVKEEYRKRFGFSKDIRIIAGAHDQVCCALGAGVYEPGAVMDSLGTTESNVCVSQELMITKTMMEDNIPVYSYPVRDLYAYMTFLTCSASLFKWFKDKMVNDGRNEFYEEYSDYIREHYKEPTGLYVLPYFSGAGTPTMDFQAKGMIYGLTLDTDRYQIYKAIMESVCFEQRINLEKMEQNKIPVKELRCIGGGAKSDLFLQLKANITGKRVIRMEKGEMGCLGAAIIAGVGSGLITDISSIQHTFSGVDRIFYPHKEETRKYEEYYQKYTKIYSICKDLWRNNI